MPRHRLFAAIAAAVLASGCSYARFGDHWEAPEGAYAVRIEHAAARVRVVTEDRTDIVVEITPGAAEAGAPTAKLSGQTWVVDGGLEGRLSGCEADAAVIRREGVIARESLPLIIIRSPREVSVSGGGALWVEGDGAAKLDLGVGGCGRWTFGDVAGATRLNAAGESAVALGAVGGDLDARMAGATEVTAASVAGPVTVEIAGSGDVTVAGGAAMGARVEIAGSGAVALAEVNGPIDIEVAGSGRFSATGGRSERLRVEVAGSGDVRFGGAVQEVDADIAGSGRVYVAAADRVSQNVAGSGGVIVGPEVFR